MAQRGNRGKARLLIRSIQRGKGQSRANLIFYFGIGFDAVSSPQQLQIPRVKILLHVSHGFQAHRHIRARQPKASERRLQDAAQMIIGDDFGTVDRRGGSGTFQGKRIEQIVDGRVFGFPGLDDENLLILIAEEETVFQQSGEDGPNTRMAAFGQTLDDFIFVVKRSGAQLPERREKARIARRLRVNQASTLASEQQQYKEPLHA